MRIWVLVLTLVVAKSASASDSSFILILESDSDEPAGSEVFQINYESLDAFNINSIATSGFSEVDIASDAGVGGFAFDGSQYHLILEFDDDRPGGEEVGLISYNSLSDFLSNTPSGSGLSSIDVHETLSIGGFASDGDQYQLVLEREIDEPGGAEVLLLVYDSIDDLLSNTPAIGTGFSSMNIPPGMSIGGFAFDGSRYHLILETDDDQPTGSEVYETSFSTLNDFKTATILPSCCFSSLDVASSFSVGGFAGVPAAIFSDGFETGGTSVWSDAIP